MEKSRQEKLNEFKTNLEATQNYSEARALCVAIREYTRKNYSTNTLAKYLTDYRKVVKQVFPTNKAWRLLGHLKLNKKERSTRAEKTSSNIAKSQKKLTKIDPKKLVSLAIELVTQPEIEGKKFVGGKRAGELVPKSYYKLALGLMLLTGRRMGEILHAAKFRANKGRKYEVRFSGAIKGDFDHQNKVFEIPVLAESKLVRDGLRELRKLKRFNSLAHVNKSASKDMNIYCRDYFGSLLGHEIKTHDLRKAYAAICDSMTGKGGDHTDAYKKEDETTDAYLSRILGHDESNVNNAKFYQKYYI